MASGLINTLTIAAEIKQQNRSQAFYFCIRLASRAVGLIGLMLWPVLSFCQNTTPLPLTISGQIADAATGNVLPHANVFLANTTLGAATDAEGRYVIRSVPVGTYELVVSLLGYEMQKTSVRITTDNAVVHLRLKATTLEMSQIEVLATPDREWRKNLQKFEGLFWGNGYQAGECKILNPEVLDFEIEKETDCFIAGASQPLRLENLRLGYRAEFIVQEFRYYLNQQEIKFAFTPRFEEMTPANDDEAQRWKANRHATYLGSLRHFLASVISGRVAPEGYEVMILPNLPWEEKEKRFNRKVTDFAEMLSPTAFPTEIEFNFKGTLQIIYKPERGDYRTSWLVVKRDHVLLNKAGYAYDGYAFFLYGDWFTQRAAEALPRDYEP